MHWTQKPENKARVAEMIKKSVKVKRSKRAARTTVTKAVISNTDTASLLKRLKAKREALNITIAVLQEEMKRG